MKDETFQRLVDGMKNALEFYEDERKSFMVHIARDIKGSGAGDEHAAGVRTDN